MSELAGRTAVVTGSSSGIGQAIALELASAGADVLIHAGSNQRGADQTAALVSELGRDVKVVVLDLSSVTHQESLVDQACQWRPVDMWINNAGADVLTGDAADWSFLQKLEMLWKVDVTATIHLSRLVGQRMLERKDDDVDQSIVNMGWDQAAFGMEGDSGEMFTATKGAIMAFTKSLAQTLAPRVRVNCLAPGWIRTAWGEGASEYWQQRANSEALLQRWGRPEDVAGVARFLVSPAAQYVTGQTLSVNGGFRPAAPGGTAE
jgi:3-oxoacyl-[acyl-carrier protein] reductase